MQRRLEFGHVSPEFGFARYVVFRTPGGATAQGVWRLKQAGYRVFTGAGLAELGCPAVEYGGIYAVFDVEFDGEYADCCWDGGALNARLLELEGRRGRLWQGFMKTHTIESRLRDLEAAAMTATELTAVWKANQVPLSAVGNQVWV